MADASTLAAHIHSVGKQLTVCTVACSGIRLDPESGIIPRALVLEHEGRSVQFGSVALGINPGQGDSEEQAYYLEHGISYDIVRSFWKERRRSSHRYHTRTRRFLDAIELTGPILWTELVKCQNPVGVRRLPPLSTIRTCIHLYLVNEMAEVPASWPIVAIGKKPFELAAMVFPSRTVIGIPHPTGSYGHFPALFESSGALRADIKDWVKDVFSSTIPDAIWLGGERS